MKVGRNDPCPCGSGKKYKHCCYAKDSIKHEAPVIEEPESDDVTEDETVAEEREKKRSSFQPVKGRARFQGEARGRSTTFKPTVHRSSQRGT